MCGEKWKVLEERANWLGSPPRVRGKDCYVPGIPAPYGITPACAGKRPCTRPLTSRTRDHPRVCGEKYDPSCKSLVGQGSPPRVRGKASGDITRNALKGITPACAGKSRHLSPSRLSIWDHPRVCGEKYLPEGATLGSLGSPPRVRGKDSAITIGANFAGITPACAGKRETRASMDFATKDHPRVCGEKPFCGVSLSRL